MPKLNRKPKFHIGDLIYGESWDESFVVIGNVKMQSGNYLVALQPNNDLPIFYVVDSTLRATPVYMNDPDDMIGMFRSREL